MAYGKKLCRPETGVLIFGIFNGILTGAGVCIEVGLLIYLYLCLFASNGSSGRIIRCGQGESELFIEAIPVLIIIGPALISFVFAVLLLQGVCKRKSGLILSYFIFGVVAAVLTLIGNIVLLVFIPNLIVVAVFFILFWYSLVLVLVWKTYNKFRTNEVTYEVCRDHELLEK